jgi:hypothetical protein
MASREQLNGDGLHLGCKTSMGLHLSRSKAVDLLLTIASVSVFCTNFSAIFIIIQFSFFSSSTFHQS